MAFVCDDLARHGVVLIPPSTANYFQLLADIEKRLRRRPKGSPSVGDDELSLISEHDTNASAILVNQASVAIASVAYFWWARVGQDRIVPHSFLPGTNPSVLLPFSLNDAVKKFDSYWHTIFPGSKRLLTYGNWFGDNTDVRLPDTDELRQGGSFFSVGCGRPADMPKMMSLTLDGVFFMDGGFSGPNRLRSWEQTVFSAEAHLECADIARKAIAPDEFFLRVQNLLQQEENGRLPPPPPPGIWWRNSQEFDPEPFRKHERQIIGWEIFNMRKRLGDEATIENIAAWVNASVPRFHKL